MHVKKETTMFPTWSACLCMSSEILEQVHGELLLFTNCYIGLLVTSGRSEPVDHICTKAKKVVGVLYRQSNWAVILILYS